MKQTLPWAAIAAVSMLLLTGCGKKSDETAAMQDSKASESPETQNFDPKKDSGRYIDDNFLVEQASKRSQIEKTIAAFWNDKAGDPKVVRKLILNRKGELLTTKRNIRKSLLFSDAQKDSMIAPLDEESMKLSRELVAFSE